MATEPKGKACLLINVVTMCSLNLIMIYYMFYVGHR